MLSAEEYQEARELAKAEYNNWKTELAQHMTKPHSASEYIACISQSEREVLLKLNILVALEIASSEVRPADMVGGAAGFFVAISQLEELVGYMEALGEQIAKIGEHMKQVSQN